MDFLPININQLIYTLSDALDLVGIDDLNHGKRVAWMALECADAMGLDSQSKEELLHGGLLHDCGVSSTTMHEYLVKEFDWEGAEAHCMQGYKLLGTAPKLAHLRNVVLYHHTPHRVLSGLELDKRSKIMANLIFLVDRVDVLCAKHCAQNNIHPLQARDYVVNEIQSLNNEHFMPSLMEVFLHVSQKDSFWMELENVRALLQKRCDMQTKTNMPLGCLRTIATLFSCFVDAKSSYTAKHSLDVASLSVLVGSGMGLDETTVLKLEIAALLHDLGKLRIPDSILDKPTSLTQQEYDLIQRHAQDTYSILSQIEGLEEIALWAGDHHEKLNGSGYPMSKNHKTLPLPSRIITVCDMMQALVQKRPYRDSMSLEDTLKILQLSADNNELDSNIVAFIQQNAKECYKAATAHCDNL